MKKKLLSRCLFGAPIGLATSFLITIFVSFGAGDGLYHAVQPDLITLCGTEIRAVALQAGLSMLLGAVFGGSSLIWDTDWSLTGMSLAHFAVCSLAMFPVAYCLRWMDRSLSGFLSYFGFFVSIYAATWIGSYIAIARKLRAINKKVGENR